MAALLGDHQLCIIFLCFFIFFFIHMDILLYKKIQSLSTSSINESQVVTNDHFYSPFRGLSIKLIMMDHVNSYILTPLAEMFNEGINFTQTFSFITPNMISFMGVCWAFLAAKFVTYDSFKIHRLSVLLFQVRNFFDALDGIVARSRLGIKSHISLSNTSGYVIDGLADSIGFGAYLLGCYIYLKRNLPKQKHNHHYLQIQFQNESPTLIKRTYIDFSFFTQYLPTKLICTSKTILFVVLCFTFQLVISCALWNRYILAYHEILESVPLSPKYAELQTEIKRSSVLWIIMWCWKIANAQALMQMLLIAVYINRLWEFLTWIQVTGFFMLFLLGFFTEIHLIDVSTYLIHLV